MATSILSAAALCGARASEFAALSKHREGVHSPRPSDGATPPPFTSRSHRGTILPARFQSEAWYFVDPASMPASATRLDMPRIQYRERAKVSDQELNRLFRSAWKNHVDREFARVLESSLGYVCAYKEDRLVGFVNVAWDGGVHGFLVNTTVEPRYQHRGVGRKLVKKAIEIAESAGLEWLHVDYEPELSEFYEECGFESTSAGLLNLRGAEPPTAATPAPLPAVVSLAMFTTILGLDAGAVLSTTPAAVTVARWLCPIAAIAGLLVGALFGRKFNSAVHVGGGQAFWALQGCMASAAIALWLVALGFALVGSVAGSLLGWIIGSLVVIRKRPLSLLLFAAGGCLIQAIWRDPWPATRFASLGAGIGLLSAPVVQAVFMLSGMLLLRHNPRNGEAEQNEDEN